MGKWLKVVERQPFLYAVWPPHGQLQVINKGMALERFVDIWPSHWGSYDDTGSLTPVKNLVGLELGTFQFNINTLTKVSNKFTL